MSCSALFVGALLFSLHLCSSDRSWPELNPALGEYQDIEKCFELGETWHTVYRNYESDPILGGTTKCVRFTGTGPPVNGAYPLLAEIGDQANETILTFGSSDGYKNKNIMILSDTAGDVSVEIYAAYFECTTCSIVRETYIDDSACAMVIPESQLKRNMTCCDFIFDLLCGTTPKFYIYDESCDALK